MGKAVDNRRAIADKLISECFWGDYSLTADELLYRLEQQLTDSGFVSELQRDYHLLMDCILSSD